jgi:hypothetical protein
LRDVKGDLSPHGVHQDQKEQSSQNNPSFPKNNNLLHALSLKESEVTH